jgi:hypothetical protein
MRIALFVLAMIGSVVGGLMLFVLSDLQQGTTVAVYAIALSVIPYCLARSYQEMRRKD